MTSDEALRAVISRATKALEDARAPLPLFSQALIDFAQIAATVTTSEVPNTNLQFQKMQETLESLIQNQAQETNNKLEEISKKLAPLQIPSRRASSEVNKVPISIYVLGVKTSVTLERTVLEDYKKIVGGTRIGSKLAEFFKPLSVEEINAMNNKSGWLQLQLEAFLESSTKNVFYIGSKG